MGTFRHQNPISQRLQSRTALWFALSLVVAVVFALDGLRLAFQFPYTVQDDARQHVFWMQRFLDPELFPNDTIADYFRSVAPLGYAALYKQFASLGIDPFLLNKFLPLILGVLSTIYCFRVCTRIFPVPFAGFLSSLLLNQNLWLRDDLSSGTPRAFIYPLLLAFMHYLLRGSLYPCLTIIIIQGLLYPQTVFISVAILSVRLIHYRDGFLKISKNRSDHVFWLSGVTVAIFTLLPYAFKVTGLGPVVTVSEARGLPEFFSQGRSALFTDNSWAYWLYAKRTGIFPSEWQYVLLFSFGCLLPLLGRYPSKFPLYSRIKLDGAAVLFQTLVASLGMFFLAHVFLFRFHLPGRYTQHSLRVLIALVDAIFIVVLWDSASGWITEKLRKFCLIKKTPIAAVTGCLVTALVLLPSCAVRAYPYRLGYLKGEAPLLYNFLSEQPKDVLVVSLSEQADFIPTFAKRSVLVSREYAIPYHTGYYRRLRQRIIESIEAHYSEDLALVQHFSLKYGVDFWILEEDSFKPEYIEHNPWLMQYQPAATNAIEMMKHGKQPALSRLTPECTVFEDKDFIVLDAQCIMVGGELEN